jgi:hypothetical protein
MEDDMIWKAYNETLQDSVVKNVQNTYISLEL